MKKEKGILSSYDSLDIDEVIITIEKTFHIKFDERDFEEVKTYGEFEKLVLDKIQGIEINDCTSQQTFYKLRKILVEEFKIPYNRINLNTKLTEIFPKNIRNNEIKKLKSSLKFENQILTFSKEQFIILTIIFITSIYFLFTNFFYGLFFLAICVPTKPVLPVKKIIFFKSLLSINILGFFRTLTSFEDKGSYEQTINRRLV